MRTSCIRTRAIALAFIAVGCSAAGGPTGGNLIGACAPGERATCDCPNGSGIQTCNAQRTYGACDCSGETSTGGTVSGSGGSAPSTGGTSGAGGTTSVGGTGAFGGTAAGGGTGGSAGTGGIAGTAGIAGTGGITGTGGGIGTGGFAGTGGTAATCPAVPAGAPNSAVQAWTVLNQTRLAAGSSCMNLAAALDTSAQAHCNYVAANSTNASCVPDPHTEVQGCTGFTGTTVQAREIAAGYPSALAYTEVLTTYGNNPTAAVPSFIDTVFHRIPLLDPWTTDMGYGGAVACDVIDIGRGTNPAPADVIVLYPYDGQTNVPPAWSGREGPAPPAPSSGWPSSYPVSIYAQGISVTEHVLTKDGDPTPLDHVWLDYQSSLVSSGLKGYFKNTAILYGAPFELSTKYRVKIVGTHAGGAAFAAEWTFTTGATRPYGT